MNKHKVTFNTATFTRNSKGRVYSHAVVVLTPIADILAQSEKMGRADWEMNLVYHTQIANGTSEFLKRNGNRFAREPDEERIQKSQARIAAGVEGEVARHLKCANDQIAALPKTDDGLSVITCAGWAGRYDLAAKLAGTVKTGTAYICTAEVTK